ncbi:hypothetical protein J2754_000225 [Halarchaeum solikamskense]|uniref:hypothetical protein n=1 Tax=Halarchaeum nitratireducens TaxID=489913 RepID=UPI001B3AAE8B|nr:hypothetical protein [Halarchaeum solikamskense]MBP2249928.1 hypothetical protein [Halarchaeum solikamskense]
MTGQRDRAAVDDDAGDPVGEFAPLHEEDAATVEGTIRGERAGPLAVCGPPYGGRHDLLERLADAAGATYRRLDPGADAAAVRDALGDGPLVVDDCHHLYERRIGGFDDLDAAVRALAATETPVVAGWNSYAWTYLAHVRDVDRAFAARVEAAPASASDLADLLLDRYEDLPTFAADRTADGIVTTRRVSATLRGRTVGVSIPVPNRRVLGPRPEGREVDPTDVVFERLAAVSMGNVGVATAIWEATRRDELRPSDVGPAGDGLDLDRETAFCLRVLLSKERVARPELDRLVDHATRALARLRRADVVTVDEGIVRLAPAAVPTAARETDRRGLQ